MNTQLPSWSQMGTTQALRCANRGDLDGHELPHPLAPAITSRSQNRRRTVCFNWLKINPITEPMLTLSETAMRLGVSPPTIRRRVAEGELRAYQLGDNTSPLRFRQRDIEEFVERHRVQPRVPA
jgi:excisionase family DNA binding protein